MHKILLAVVVSAFATSAFAAEKPKAKTPYKPKTEFSKCDPVKNPSACKAKVHKKAPKKPAEKKKK